MIEFLAHSEDTRRNLIAQVSNKTGKPVNAIEKDWWVTLVLKAVFSLPMSKHFIFKGGTSLSKAWKLIDRFSEDIDIALAPEAFDKTYKIAPSHGYVKGLKRAGCTYTNTVIMPALEKRLIELGVPQDMVIIEADVVRPDLPDKDPQTLYIRFPSLYEPNLYLTPPVKVEFGVRALREPFGPAEIRSILGEETDSPAYTEASFTVTAVMPRKTFMEKLLLLHEKFEAGLKTTDPGERQSRHLSDLVHMTRSGIVEEVIGDMNLYAALLEHRKHYVRIKDVDYAKMQLCGLGFIPPFEALDIFRKDYDAMKGEMIDSDAPGFDELLAELRMINFRLLEMGHSRDINDVITKAYGQIGNLKGEGIRTIVIYPFNEFQPLGPTNIAEQFTVDFIRQGDKMIVHRVRRTNV